MWLLEGRPYRTTAAGAPDESDLLAEFPLAAVAREVADVTGAGDTVVATIALALAAGATLTEAATLANYAAGLSVARFGPATVSPDELLTPSGKPVERSSEPATGRCRWSQPRAPSSAAGR